MSLTVCVCLKNGIKASSFLPPDLALSFLLLMMAVLLRVALLGSSLVKSFQNGDYLVMIIGKSTKFC